MLMLIQAADTLVMLQARDGLETASLVAGLVLTTAFVLILVALVVLLFQLRGIQRTVADLAGRLEKRVDPILDRGKEVAANVEFISGAIRTDIQRVSDSVRSLSDRLQSASDRMEERIGEFNALMEVVQSEAEDVFIGSTATMRGIREGARALGGRGKSRTSDADEALDALMDEDDDALLEEAGLPPRDPGSAASETDPAPRPAPGGAQATGNADPGSSAESGAQGAAGAARRGRG